VITRDVVIVVGTALLHYLVVEVQVRPSWIGKTATALQMVAISMVLVLPGSERTVVVWGQSIELNYLDIPVTLAGVFTLISGIGYVMRGIRQFQAGGHAF
jgi:phosphatidylglycerophosphate synthase